ncbi:MAG: 3'-5' exonuclease [Crocinitomicaceae bacterium]|nr:3'-5' exonuclease [Crocinitomicaceae bacterium]
MQLQKINLEKILFLDIETVPEVYRFSELDSATAALFDSKTKFQQKDGLSAADVYDKAGIYAEFGKIICISCGIVHDKPHGKEIRLKSIANDDERQLLLDFAKLLNQHYNMPHHILCGHNAKEFDFPFIARRMLLHGIDLPSALDIAGKKPWEIAHLDTMELWKFGDYKHYSSLSLLCHIFRIPTPKDDITGADVARVYYEDKDLQRIVKYCQKDVVALIQLFLRFRNESLVEEDNIHE